MVRASQDWIWKGYWSGGGGGVRRWRGIRGGGGRERRGGWRCVYPQVAKYKGTGDTNEAGNFAGVAAKLRNAGFGVYEPAPRPRGDGSPHWTRIELWWSAHRVQSGGLSRRFKRLRL